MTAPVVTSAPAPAAAPAEGASPVSPTFTPVVGNDTPGLNAMIERVSRKAPVLESAPPEAPAAGDVPVGGLETVQAPDPAPTAEPTATVEPSGEVVVDDGEVQLRAERNPDGTFKGKIDPSQKFDITMKDPESGETRTYSKTLPEVLRMARDGVWGQKVKDEVQYYRTNVPEWEKNFSQLKEQHQSVTSQLSQLQEQLEAQMALNRELLTAPDELVIQRREQFAHEQSPEQRLAKLEAQLRQEAEARAVSAKQQEQARQAESFIQTRLAPVITDAEQALGGTDFARRAVAGQIAIETQPLLVNGQLPPEVWPKVEAYLRGPFQQWVKQAAASLKPSVDPEAVRKAQAVAQAAVNSAGQLLRPVGTPSASTAKPTTPPKNVNDAMSRIINRPLAGA